MAQYKGFKFLRDPTDKQRVGPQAKAVLQAIKDTQGRKQGPVTRAAVLETLEKIHDESENGITLDMELSAVLSYWGGPLENMGLIERIEKKDMPESAEDKAKREAREAKEKERDEKRAAKAKERADKLAARRAEKESGTSAAA